MSDNTHRFTYDWQGQSLDGTRCAGQITASDIFVAEQQIRHQGILLLKIRRQSAWKALLSPAISSQDIASITRQLATLFTAGIPLLDGLNMIAASHDDKTVQNTLQRLQNHIKAGKTFSQALELEPSHFPPLFCKLIHAGEISGKLDKVLLHLADHQQQVQLLKNRARKLSLIHI